jgi:hypothetical protein
MLDGTLVLVGMLAEGPCAHSDQRGGHTARCEQDEEIGQITAFAQEATLLITTVTGLREWKDN